MTSSLKFGTSGLRGLVEDLLGAPAYAYTRAFATAIRENPDFAAASAAMIGRDLRASSPDISALCVQAFADAGLEPVDCGAVPTPALALAAMAAGLPAVMVTGSHIPEDRNGLKFYTPRGEIEKADEAGILARHGRLALSSAPSVTRCGDALQGALPGFFRAACARRPDHRRLPAFIRRPRHYLRRAVCAGGQACRARPR